MDVADLFRDEGVEDDPPDLEGYAEEDEYEFDDDRDAPMAAAAAAPPSYDTVPVLERAIPARRGVDDDWCFLCDVGDEGHDNPYYRSLVEHIHKTSGLVSDESLCQDVQDMYNRTLRPYQTVPRDWSLHSILQHIEEHALNPVLMLRRTLRVQNKLLRLMEDGMLRQRMEMGPDRVSTTNLQVYNKLVEARSKTIRELMHANTKQK